MTTESNKHDLGSIPRELAIKINPYIDHCFTGTALNCMYAVEELGFLIEAAMEGGATKLNSVSIMSQTIAAALSYEVHSGQAPEK